MRALATILLGLPLFAGCYDASPLDGQLLCSIDRKCPAGFYCASDTTCYREGHVPLADLGGTDAPIDPDASTNRSDR